MSGRLSRRRLLRGAAAGVGAAALVACSSGEQGPGTLVNADTAREPGKVWPSKNDWTLADETKAAVRGGTYPAHRTSDWQGHRDPLSIGDHLVPGSAHVYEHYFGKTRRPGVEPGTLQANVPTPALAESWEFADNGATVTLTMRQGVKFHNIPPVNGRVMEMDDWRTSQERHLATGLYRTVLGELLEKTEYPDPRHMTWKFKRPYAPIQTRIYNVRLANVILPKELNANPSLAESVSIGTGFKILASYEPSIAVHYRKHPEYWGGDPFIDRWIDAIIPEYSNRYAQFVSSAIMDFEPTARDVLTLHKDAPGTVIVANPLRDDYATRYRFGRINALDQAWADPRVRIAIRRSIDFKTISEVVANKTQFDAAGVPIEMQPTTHVAQDPSFYLNPEKGELGALSQNYLYNPAEARKLTAAAGYTHPIPLPYAIILSQGVYTETDQLTLDSLAASGAFDLQVIRVPSAEAEKYRINNEFTGVMGTPIGAAADPDHYLGQEYHSTISRPKAFSDPQIDALVMAQREALNTENRWKIIKELQHKLAEFHPVITPLHEYTTFGFRWPWLHNANWGERGSPPAGRDYWGAHLHWLDPEMPNRDRRG